MRVPTDYMALVLKLATPVLQYDAVSISKKQHATVFSRNKNAVRPSEVYIYLPVDMKSYLTKTEHLTTPMCKTPKSQMHNLVRIMFQNL